VNFFFVGQQKRRKKQYRTKGGFCSLSRGAKRRVFFAKRRKREKLSFHVGGLAGFSVKSLILPNPPVNIFCHFYSAPSIHGEYFKAKIFQKISRTKLVGGGYRDTFIKSKILKFCEVYKFNYALLQHGRDLKFCTDATLGALSLFPNFQKNSSTPPRLRPISLFD